MSKMCKLNSGCSTGKGMCKHEKFHGDNDSHGK